MSRLRRSRTSAIQGSVLLTVESPPGSVAGISAYAETGGLRYRDWGSKAINHRLHSRSASVEELCDYIKRKMGTTRARCTLASYVSGDWNWIPPVYRWKWRTSRAASYMTFAVKNGYVLPGKKTIPDQDCRETGPYYKALKAADDRLGRTQNRLTAMKDLLSSMLAKQLYESTHKLNSGGDSPTSSRLSRQPHTAPAAHPICNQIVLILNPIDNRIRPP